MSIEPAKFRAKVLVVDDEPDNIKLLTDICIRMGFEVVSAADGEEALAKTRSERPDVILLDLMMPKVDGLTALGALKADPVTAEIPVIIVSAMTDIGGKMKGIELGAQDYVTKPFRLFEVTRRLEAAIAVREMRRRLLDAERELVSLRVSTDSLPGAETYHQLSVSLDSEVARARRYGRSFALLMLAVEEMNELREREGRDAADRALAGVVGTVRSLVRGVDRIFRVHPAELALLLPESDNESAKRAATRILAELRSVHPGVRLAIGWSVFPGAELKTGDDMIRAAARDLDAGRGRGG